MAWRRSEPAPLRPKRNDTQAAYLLERRLNKFHAASTRLSTPVSRRFRWLMRVVAGDGFTIIGRRLALTLYDDAYL